MKVVYHGICDIGLKRTVNQDSILTYGSTQKEMYVFVVADGMGGHSDGELASGAITGGIGEWCKSFQPESVACDFQHIVMALQNKIKEINRHIYQQLNHSQICGSTCVVFLVYRNCYAIFSVGDSRIYQKRGFRVCSVMVDDVWENQRRVRENLSKKQREQHPDYGKLVMAMGVEEEVSISRKTDVLKAGDSFLLCSDGLYKYCSEKEIKKALKKVSEQNIPLLTNHLLEQTHAQGAKDNVSIILAKCI